MHHDPAQPAFEAAGLVIVPYFPESAQKTIIQDINGFVTVVGVPSDHRHQFVEIEIIQFLLAQTIMPTAAFQELVQVVARMVVRICMFR